MFCPRHHDQPAHGTFLLFLWDLFPSWLFSCCLQVCSRQAACSHAIKWSKREKTQTFNLSMKSPQKHKFSKQLASFFGGISHFIQWLLACFIVCSLPSFFFSFPPFSYNFGKFAVLATWSPIGKLVPAFPLAQKVFGLSKSRRWFHSSSRHPQHYQFFIWATQTNWKGFVVFCK